MKTITREDLDLTLITAAVDTLMDSVPEHESVESDIYFDNLQDEIEIEFQCLDGKEDRKDLNLYLVRDALTERREILSQFFDEEDKDYINALKELKKIDFLIEEEEADHWTKEMPDRTSFHNKEGEEVIKIEMPDFIFQPRGTATPKGYRKVKMFEGARLDIVKRKGY